MVPKTALKASACAPVPFGAAAAASCARLQVSTAVASPPQTVATLLQRASAMTLIFLEVVRPKAAATVS